MGPDAALSRGRVRPPVQDVIGDIDAEDVEIQEMVDEHHQPVAVGSRGAVERARGEILRRDVVGGLEEVVELREDVGDAVSVGVVVWSVLDGVGNGGVDGDLGT